MQWLSVTIGIYRRVFARAGILALRNWRVLGSVFAYSFLFAVAAPFAIWLGFIGGFLLSLVTAACVGSFLYLVETMIRTGRVNRDDFVHSFGAYLWDIVGINFVLWLFWQVVTPLLFLVPQGPLIGLCLNILIVVYFNAVPELIYLGHHSLLSLLSESYRFVGENWIEWFPPNFLFAVVVVGLWRLPASTPVASLLQASATALFIYFAMVVRGLLFIELSGTTRRGREFRHRMDG